MKNILFFFLMAICLATVPASFSQTPVVPGAVDNNIDAAAVMDRYFLALASGDTTALEAVLGGDLLLKRKRLLSNPAYSNHLTKLYQNTDFSILSIQNSSQDSVTVEVLITLNENETIRKSYQLKRLSSNGQLSSFVIVGENTIAEPM